MEKRRAEPVWPAVQLHHHGPIAAAMGALARQLSAVSFVKDRPDMLSCSIEWPEGVNAAH
jgi:hypothetical protein